MNTVSLVGQVAAPLLRDGPLRPGWGSLLLRVPRRGPEGGRGTFSVRVALPPELAAREIRERDVGAFVAVVGMLSAETDQSGDPSRVHHAVIAQQIERLPAWRDLSAA